MQNQTQKKPKPLRSLLLGGILPLVAYTLVEEYFGTKWGLVAGLALGMIEIISEKITNGKVDSITWAGNAILFVMGGISLLTNEGVWFKLQPAILEFASGALMLGSVFMKKPFLTLMADKQGTFDRFPLEMQGELRKSLSGLTARVALFFFAHAALATWAALYWSTKAWVFLKGIGFTGSMIVYMLAEAIVLRQKLRPKTAPPAAPTKIS